ncbi:hypothetical protein YC2023_037642 [Brassica napus]
MAIKLHVLPEKHLMTLPESWNHHTPWRKTMVMESQTQTLVALVWGEEIPDNWSESVDIQSLRLWIPPLCLLRNLSGNGTSTPSGDGELSPDGQFATQNGDSPGFRSLISSLGSQSLVSRFGQRNLCVGRYKARGKAEKRDLVAKVSLQVYIVDCPKEPIIEILQFEKHQDMDQLSDHEHKDPYGNLLKCSAHKPLLSSGSGSQLFSFVHFRSYSMFALPAPNTAPVTGPVKTESSKPSFDLEDWNCYSGQTLWNGHKSGTEELLSFRGVPLERDKFSVRCGLEGICIPGKKMEEETFDISSFTADCNTDKHLI